MPKKIKVTIVEDNKITCHALEERINDSRQFKVISTHYNYYSAVDFLKTTTPDILLVDLDLPDGNGIEIIISQSEAHPDLPIMVISVFGDESHVIQAIQAGARGYLLKDSDSHEIEVALEQLLQGGSPITPSIARHLIKRFHNDTKQNASAENNLLSERELEVLVFASKGFSYVETAKMLELSVNTVASYTKRIYVKLAVNSRNEAVYEATRMGLMKHD